jgi:hypothetical protein
LVDTALDLRAIEARWHSPHDAHPTADVWALLAELRVARAALIQAHDFAAINEWKALQSTNNTITIVGEMFCEVRKPIGAALARVQDGQYTPQPTAKGS